MVRRKQQLCRTALSGKLFATTFAALILLCTATASAQKAPDKSQVEHGRYLVQQVGLCGDCHTPRDDHGQPIESKALRGAGIGFKPLAEMPWGGYAPPIAGLPGFTDAQAITFLTTGKDPTGSHPKPPMPPYRFNRRDAAAVVAYLRSVAAQKKLESAQKQ
jgi:mono/diheme cytochrome c family protein